MDRARLREIVRVQYLPKDYDGWEIRTVPENAAYEGMGFDFTLFFKRPDRSIGHWQHFALCLTAPISADEVEHLLAIMEKENLSGGTLYLIPGVTMEPDLVEQMKESGIRTRVVTEEAN